MSITSDDFQVTSSNPTGATIATDYVNNTHFQEVKINTGAAGADSILSDTAPLPISYSSAASQTYVPAAGNTSGTLPVQVQITGGASFDVADVIISAGNITNITAGVSCDIRTVTGVFPVASSALLGITAQITGDVKLAPSTNNIGDVDVLTVVIPTYGFTSAGMTVGSTSDLAQTTLPAGTFTTGFRITNLGPSTVYIGATAAASLTAAGFDTAQAHGYPLMKFATIFIEATNSDGLRAVIDGTGTADIRICGS